MCTNKEGNAAHFQRCMRASPHVVLICASEKGVPSMIKNCSFRSCNVLDTGGFRGKKHKKLKINDARFY